MKTIQDYKIIKLKHKPDCDVFHTILAKENSVRFKDPAKPPGRTLFLTNIPPYVTEDNIKSLFSQAGEIVSVTFVEKPGKNDEKPAEANNVFNPTKPIFKYKSSYIVFKSTKSIENALKISTLNLFDQKGKTSVKSALNKWMEEYLSNIHTEEELQQDINSFMAKYDKNEQESIEAEKNTDADADGWITVPKRGRNAGFEQKDSVIKKLEEKMEQSKKKKELKNFYTFQIRESKMQNIVSLRKKFEEDKCKIETLKKSRRFNPFGK